jgi:hypothetical protein
MKIDRKLNLVLTVDGEDGHVLYIHHTPIRREIFEQHYMFITKAMTSMYSEGLHPLACNRIAYFRMKELAREELNVPSATAPVYKYPNIENTLFAEIWRNTNALMPAARGGWETVPFYELMKGNDISEDDAAEVQNYICFFTGASWVHDRGERRSFNASMEGSGWQTTLSDVTEYRNSLPTLKPTENTGESPKPLSVPS